MEIKVEMKVMVDDTKITEEEIKIENSDESILTALAELALDRCHEKCKKELTEHIQST